MRSAENETPKASRGGERGGVKSLIKRRKLPQRDPAKKLLPYKRVTTPLVTFVEN